jgi:hypothetical protein
MFANRPQGGQAVPKPLRVLFCIGVTEELFCVDHDEHERSSSIISEAFANLAERFDVTVLGTMDDDRLVVGPSTGWPWTAYVLADAPDLDAVYAVCDILRSTEIGDGQRLWRYLRIEARVGRPLFFANA